MPADIYSLAPLSFTGPGGSFVLPCENHAFSADIIANPHFHSGNMSPTQVTIPGANPKITVSAPFEAAFLALGLGMVKLTALEVYLSKYADFVRMTGLNHVKIGLTTGAFAGAQITDWSVDVDGILMANISIDLYSDDQTNPFVLTPSVALPTLSGNPALHTLGPVEIAGTVIPGASSDSGSMNANTVVQRTDGDLYPRVGARPQITPTARIAHNDPVAILTALGLLGSNIAVATELYFKKYDPTTGITSSTSAVLISIGAGRVIPDGWQANQGAVATTGFTVHGIVADGITNPLAVTIGATPPATP